MEEINIVYLSLGSNLGDRLHYLNQSLQLLKRSGKIISCSNIYETAAIGFESNDDFLNLCIGFETSLSPHQLLDEISNIESTMGRKRSVSERYTSRIIDIDIIFYKHLIVNSERLTIPHPCYHERLFVLYPLNDIASEYVDPYKKVSVSELLSSVTKNQDIKLYASSINF